MSSGYPSGLSASAFELLIRVYWSPTGWLDWESRTAPGKDVRAELERAELVCDADGEVRLSVRGLVLARHILETPLPVQAWEVHRYPMIPGFPPAERS